ncbi:MAG TPA: SDR family NAD(P)-dependent oxidoreductase [Chloroflexota bacterium]|nr:SDR family NAD(P)-dependent oxidoreductase [Chloroflexota bacterium]
MFQKDTFKGKVAVVTGAAAGIGEAVARGLAAHGADVVLLDVRAEDLERIAVELRELGTRSFAAPADVTSSAQVQTVVGQCIQNLGRVDILVNAAGGFKSRCPVAEMPDDMWNSIVNLNLTGVFVATRAALPRMIEQRYGRIVSVSSDAALASRHISNAAYAAAKAGIVAFSRHLALEVGQYNITVNATAPGVTLSSRIRNLYNDKQLAEFAAKNPLGRVGELEDQVLPILFLASDAAKHITGEVLKVSGGY